MATFQTESNVFEHIWLEELPGPGEPDFHAAFDALYGHTTRVPFARTGVMNGEPVVAVNGRHGFECWSPSSRPWIIETMIPAYDAIIGTCDHDRTVLAAWFFDELAAFHLDDGGPCGDVFKIGPKEGERLALAEGRPVVARLDDHVVLDYDHGYLSDREPSSGYVLLEDDCPSGCYCRWSIVHADDHGRILVAQHAEAIHRYDLATGAHLGAPVTGVRGTPYGARTGRLRDRDVILVMAGTVLSVHDAATGARIERIAAHTRVFDAATPGDGRIVAMTENGPLFHDTDASQ